MFLFSGLALALLACSSSAFADNSKIPIMSHDQREQIFNKVPQFQGNSNINYQFGIIITPTGAQVQNIVLSQDNYTALKNNVGFFTACGDFLNGLCEPPIVVQSQPTMNYCPLAKIIVTNQDGYLYKLYNKTAGKDLTGFVYPQYCHIETGANPINGDNTIVSVPEFGGFVALAIFTGMFVYLCFIERLHNPKWRL